MLKNKKTEQHRPSKTMNMEARINKTTEAVLTPSARQKGKKIRDR